MDQSRSKNMIKNRMPAAIQITAEQLIQEAGDRASQSLPSAPRRHVADAAELASHRLRVRKEFEDRLRINRHNLSVWMRYAKWEGAQGEIDRSRSIYERALEINYKDPIVWTRYAEQEMRARFMNRARNVFDRAVSLLPRIDSLWYKYTYLEEMLGNIDGTRIIFERWMHWEPEQQAWLSYAKFEERQGKTAAATARSRGIYERMIACRPILSSYLRYSKWEEKRNSQFALARRIFERALTELPSLEITEDFYSSFALFEARCGEDDRARLVFEFGLSKLDPTSKGREMLADAFSAFQRQRGDRNTKDVVLAKRRVSYEEALEKDRFNYDMWLDYIKMEEEEAFDNDDENNDENTSMITTETTSESISVGKDSSSSSSPNMKNSERIRTVYERAVGAVPPSPQKTFWKRYIYLWLRYAIYEELVTKNISQARAVYTTALSIVPHKTFTFGKLWLAAAHFEVRQRDLQAARKLLGRSLGLCPKENVLRGYIVLEQALGEVDRCRILLEKFIQLFPQNAQSWIKFAEFERALDEEERARAILALALEQPALDMPETCWKAAIDLEADLGEVEKGRALYNQLLERTQHVKVWLSKAAFEATVANDISEVRRVYESGFAALKETSDGGEQRALLIDAWRAFEATKVELAEQELEAVISRGSLDVDVSSLSSDVQKAKDQLAHVESNLPKQVKKRRLMNTSAGAASISGSSSAPPAIYEEYFEYIFPDSEEKPAHLKLLDLAQKWKAKQKQKATSEESKLVISEESSVSERVVDNNDNDDNAIEI
jgi:crooked neck